MKTLVTLLASLSLGLTTLPAQEESNLQNSEPTPRQVIPLPKALKEARADLEKSLKKLSKTRQKIAAEKPKLSAEFAAVKSELLSKRRQAELVRMSQSDRAISLQKLRAELNLLTQDLTYTSGLIDQLPEQLSDTYPSVAHDEFAPIFQPAIAQDRSLDRGLERQTEVLVASLDHLENLLGGRIIQAKVVDPSGEQVSGKAAIFGPIAVFANGQLGGQIHDSFDPIPHLQDRGDFDAAKKIVSGQEATLNLDLTGGSAQALAQLNSGPIELMRKGGFWVYPILLMALISAISAIIKFAKISAIRLPRDAWIADILSALRSGKIDAAKEITGQTKHPVGPLLNKALDSAEGGSEVVEEVIYESMIGVQSRLQKWLPFIAITAATAPLLGLLGTVSGMIRTFNVIQVFGSGDPKPLAGGISEALITTLFGLVVAIPSLILHAMLSRRCQGILQSTEQLGLTLVNGLRRDEMKRK